MNPTSQESILPNKSKTYLILIFAVAIVLFVLYYISHKLNLIKTNCSRLNKEPNTTVLSIKDPKSKIDVKDTLNNYFIKTAYNCCCTGNFKNDYVDLCALKNCASNGVRALDFQIYSLNDKPIVSASSVTSNQYKEIYNHISFHDAMTNVSKWFITDSTNVNSGDPLFLIFRLHSTNERIYNMMAQSLNNIFGYNSLLGNMIYIVPQNNTLDTTQLTKLLRKVVIIVDTTYADKSAFENSKLSSFTSLITGNSLTNHMYRESELLSVIDVNKSISTDTNVSNTINILYPNLQVNKNNYDFVTTGIFNKISFIGMNFQYYDLFLTDYNAIFSNCAILNKNDTLKTMCSQTQYSPTKTCKNLNSTKN
jgi:hypothetical protein